MDNVSTALLTATRKIIRASDIHSSQMRRLTGLSSAQLLLLMAVRELPDATAGQLAQHICLSQATTTTLLDKLEAQNLIQRNRSDSDRRKVHVVLTEQGMEKLASAPAPIQAHFIEKFEKLAPHERTAVLSALQHVVEMMEPPASAAAALDDDLVA